MIIGKCHAGNYHLHYLDKSVNGTVYARSKYLASDKSRWEINVYAKNE